MDDFTIFRQLVSAMNLVTEPLAYNVLEVHFYVPDSSLSECKVQHTKNRKLNCVAGASYTIVHW